MLFEALLGMDGDQLFVFLGMAADHPSSERAFLELLELILGVLGEVWGSFLELWTSFWASWSLFFEFWDEKRDVQENLLKPTFLAILGSDRSQF